jgi:hypothetical protein
VGWPCGRLDGKWLGKVRSLLEMDV